MAATVLCRGGTACVHSLQGRPELNGEIVTLGSFDGAADRWVCRTQDGGNVSLRAANLQPVRAGGGAAPSARVQMPAWVRGVAALPWAHFVGGLCLTLAARFLLGGGSQRPSSKHHARSFQSAMGGGFGAMGAAGRAYAPAVVSYLPAAALVGVLFVVWALFVDAGGGAQGTRLQRQVRSVLARTVSAVGALSEGPSALQLVLLSVGLMLSWSLYSDQLRLDLDMSRLVFVPIIAYVLWRQRGNMSPFQMLWMLDMLMRLFRPTGHGRGGGGFGYGGYGGGGMYRRPRPMGF